jgi:hypothetical protein
VTGQAISEFNLARKDDTWGPLALTHMVELYLNPDQEGAWEERETGPIDETTSDNIAVAEALLRELRPKARYVRDRAYPGKFLGFMTVYELTSCELGIR